MSLFGRIAGTAVLLFVVGGLLGLFVWRPSSRAAFEQRTETLLTRTEGGFRAIAGSVVEDVVGYGVDSAASAGEQRARALADLPLELYTDAEGRLDERRLREALLRLVADPKSTLPEKTALVRGEILRRTGEDVRDRLADLREEQGRAATLHGERAAWQAVNAWGGLLRVLLALGALVLDRIVVRPVRATTGAVVRFGEGQRGSRAAVSGGGEIATLAKAFNATADAVERAEHENAELRASLEEKVKERTTALVRAARASTAGTMAGGVAHEFNNLLGGILGCAEAAQVEKPSAEVAELLAMIQKTATRGVGVTKAMLRATRAEPERGTFEPAALFDEALAEVRPPPGIEIRRAFQIDLVAGDVAMVRQVLANLIRNAIDVMGDSGTLVLECRSDPNDAGGVVLVVGDDGPGIDPSVRDILFEPFVTTRAGGREGVGLGLFLCDRLVAAHGGRIDVETGPDTGTTFLVHLPSARDS